MRVLPISNNYNTKQQSFNGLWGATSKNIDIDPTLGINTVYVTFYYYPFADESKEYINEIVQSHSNAYLDTPFGNQKPKYMVNECKICSTIPFSQDDYDSYYDETNPDADFTESKQRLHAFVANKFINHDYNNQQSAANEIFSKKARRKMFDELA